MGYRIFILCLRQLKNNVSVAFQLSWFWMLAYIAMFAAFGLGAFLTSQNPNSFPIHLFFLAIAGAVVGAVSLSTIAIGWHRLVLRDEMPNSFYVLRREWPIGRYFWNIIKTSFAILIMMIPAFFIVLFPIFSMFDPSVLVDNIPGFTKIFLIQIAVQLVLGVVATWLFLRIGTVLPALAVDKRMTLRESFRLTRPISGQLVITAFCIVLLQLFPLLLHLVLGPIIGPTSIIFIGITVVVTIVFTFISFFVSFGILTVVYGHLAENKPI